MRSPFLSRLVILLHLLSSAVDVADSLTVNSHQILSIGNCSGKLDEFLCNCLAQNDTVDVHLLPGRYDFSQPSCILQDKTRIAFTGNSTTNTVIYCNGFNLLFINTLNVLISNIEMVNCGNIVSNMINQSFSNVIPQIYFGAGSRFTIMFISAANVTISNLSMKNNLGYSIITSNALGVVRLSQVHVVNTTFEKDKNCRDLDSGPKTDFSCSGSGVLFYYYDFSNGFDFNSSLSIDNCFFTGNKNIAPLDSFTAFSDVVNTAYYRDKVPLIGAGCIALYYVQHNFTVTTNISNTIFYNNNGTYSATVGIAHFQSTVGETNFNNCTFKDNNRISLETNEMKLYGSQQRGGVVLLYSIVRVKPGLFPVLVQRNPIVLRILTISNCSFIKMGGNRGAAVFIGKNSADYLTIVVRIFQCNFIENQADSGSAIFAKVNQFLVSGSSGGIQINFTDVIAINNTLSPDGTLEHSSGTLITGVFSFQNCRTFIHCEHFCSFTGNQPSVIYGDNSGIVLSGTAVFHNNTARFGGAVHLSDSFMFVYTRSNFSFQNNFAYSSGGAIYGEFANTNEQSEDYCPIEFVGDQEIFDIAHINQLNVTITFQKNFAVSRSSLQSISSDVFYICSWYPDTITQIKLGRETPVVNGTRDSVYHHVFTFIPDNTTDDQLWILADLPCLCNNDNTYNTSDCLTKRSFVLNKVIIPGRSFNLSIVALDVVGSVGFSDKLFGDVYHTDISDGQILLDDDQYVRPFSVVKKACTTVDFTVFFRHNSSLENGTLELSLLQQFTVKIFFKFSDRCPTGFTLVDVANSMFGCVCDKFFNQRVHESFECSVVTGNITRHHRQAWLSTIDGDLQYTGVCSPTYCHDKLITFVLSEEDVLCTNHHSGRVCGGCEGGFSRVFGSDTCKKCDNAWLATIVLYVILGIVLVLILFALKITVTFGIINGLVFFCNVMSINEQLFFNTKRSNFSFLRVFISLINLDLGFEICFYDGMTQLAKSGLQFVFPVYLWLLMIVIIFAHKRISIPAHTVQVFATLFLLSYAKVLHAVVDVLTYTDISSSNQGSIFAWRPDPTVSYLTDGHVALFIIALLFLIFFVVPFALVLTFPNRFMRYRQMNYFYPLVDCFAAPFKDNYRYWFGTRAVLLIYLALTEAVLFSNDQALLLSNIFVVGFFAFAQAFILPFKTLLSNVFDLLFMGIFLILCIATHILYQDDDDVNSTVKILGYFSFMLFCFIVIYHVYDYRIKDTSTGLKIRYKLFQVQRDYLLRCKFFEYLNHIHDQHFKPIITKQDSECNRYRESFLQHDN